MLPIVTVILFVSAARQVSGVAKCLICTNNLPSPYPAEAASLNSAWADSKYRSADCQSSDMNKLDQFLQPCSGRPDLAGIDASSPDLIGCYNTFFYSDAAMTKAIGVIRDCIKVTAVSIGANKASDFSKIGIYKPVMGMPPAQGVSPALARTYFCDPTTATDGCNNIQNIVPLTVGSATDLQGYPAYRGGGGTSPANSSKPAGPSDPSSQGGVVSNQPNVGGGGSPSNPTPVPSSSTKYSVLALTHLAGLVLCCIVFILF